MLIMEEYECRGGGGVNSAVTQCIHFEQTIGAKIYTVFTI